MYCFFFSGCVFFVFFFFFQAEDGIRDLTVTGVQTCALPISICALRARQTPARPGECVCLALSAQIGCILLLRDLCGFARLSLGWGKCSGRARHSSPHPFGPARKRGIRLEPRNESTRVQRKGQYWKRMPHLSNAIDGRSEPQWFSTTHWSLVRLAGEADSPRASEALEKLCRAYRLPLYSYIRRLGHGPEDAEDLTQAFFAKLLQRNFWARADREKGRFRSFLLTALRHFLADERDRGKTAKRGGGFACISIDEQGSEERYKIGRASCRERV